MDYRLASRIIAAASLAVAIPLIALLVAWYPAKILAVNHYYRALKVAGTESYRQDTLRSLRQSVLDVVVYTGAMLAICGYGMILRQPKPSRDLKIWLFGTTVAAADIAMWKPSLTAYDAAFWLFASIPLVVGVLSVVGACVSWKVVRSEDR